MRTAIKDTIKSEVGGISLIALGGLIIASLSTGTAVWDNQPVGAVGSFLARVSLGLTGDGRFILAAFIILIGLRAIFLPGTGFFSGRLFGCLIVFLEILLYKHFPFSEGNALSILREGFGGAGGGVLGALLSLVFVKSFGTLGTKIIMYACGAVAFILITGLSFQDIAKALWNGLRNFGRLTLKELGKFLYTEEDDLKIGQDTLPQQHPPIILNADTENVALNEAIELSADRDSGKRKKRKSDVNKELSDILPEMNNKPDEAKPLEIDKNLSKQYLLPSLGLLKQNLRLKNSRMNKDLSDKVLLLEETLRSFGVNAKVNQVSYGPTITRFELQPAPGVKVSKIQSLADDIALNLAAAQVRIEAPIPGKSAVGIEVPNKEISQVMFREVLETEIFQNASSKLTVALGKDIAGNPIIADLAKMPHLLIAGATGSGKSVCLNSLICSLLFKASPAELKLMMIDPKMVELTTFNGIPHLIAPVVTDAKKAATALKWMVNEMEHRYELFAGAGVRNIESYNNLKSREKPPESSSYLPYVAVIIDELADLMLVSPADVEDAICRLAQMARAAGIHLVVATQRPSVDVITGLIKANIPSRIAFAVSSQTDSRVILDSNGAEKLLGKGDMLFLPIGAAKPIRVQGVFVSDSEVEKTVEFWKEQGKPEYEEGITKLEENQTEIADEDDPLLSEAVRIFLESGQASISLLQRRLHVGYTRAARLIDQMEQKKIVGGFEGSKPRALLIGWDDFQQMFNKL